MTDPPKLRVLVVDDQGLMRDGLRTLLQLEPDMSICGTASDGASAVERYGELEPDVVLMDIRMPGVDGVEATRRILAEDPAARVIILTTFDDDDIVFEGLRAGARGYLLKDVSGSELADAVRTVARGGALMEPSVARKVMTEFARLDRPRREADRGLVEPLTDRERDVLGRVARGLNNREIARELVLAEGTVKNYVTSVLQKLGVRDRTQAALRARELGILDDRTGGE